MQNNKKNILRRIQDCIDHPALQSLEKVKPEHLNYEIFLAEHVIKACSTAMRDCGIVATIDIKDYSHTQYDKTTKKNKKTGEVDIYSCHYIIVTGTATFYNIEDKNDYISIGFCGAGENESDKAVGGANTYGKKYAFMNMFLIQDGEDTDNVASVKGRNDRQNRIITQSANTKLNKSIEVLTNDQDLITKLLKDKFIQKPSYAAPDTEVLQKWISVEAYNKYTERLQEKGYQLNTDLNFWYNEQQF